MSGLHVLYGSGAIGMAVMETLVARGERVRMVNRSGRADVPDGVEVVAGDASDPAVARSAARDATVVYQLLNPPYDRWPQEFPGLQDGVVAAAEATGARLVVMDNC